MRMLTACRMFSLEINDFCFVAAKPIGASMHIGARLQTREVGGQRDSPNLFNWIPLAADGFNVLFEVIGIA